MKNSSRQNKCHGQNPRLPERSRQMRDLEAEIVGRAQSAVGLWMGGGERVGSPEVKNQNMIDRPSAEICALTSEK